MFDDKVDSLHMAYARYVAYHSTTRLLLKYQMDKLQEAFSKIADVNDLPTYDDNSGASLLQMTHEYLLIDYALLYVVIEHYKSYKLKSPNLDELLNNKQMIGKLKTLRDCVFHPRKMKKYEKEVYDFIDMKGASEWIRKVDTEFSNYFINDPFMGEQLRKTAEWLKSSKFIKENGFE